ncbi:MAG TPA: hypothetical protein VFN35_09265 [Ktedonobacteraceae bacterium]|nr:hypothetical protein [Ktedonobacteraceae bacterium]
MKRRRLVEDLRGSISMSAGWLFADLLLVLAMLFLAANTMGIHPPPVVAATPVVTPTQVALPPLEQTYHRFVIRVDAQQFLDGKQRAVDSVRQQITGQAFLHKRNAGLVVAFGSAHDNCVGEHAYDIARKVYVLVRQIGQSNAAFSKTVNYEPLCNLRDDINTITVDIFLFSQL